MAQNTEIYWNGINLGFLEIQPEVSVFIRGKEVSERRGRELESLILGRANFCPIRQGTLTIITGPHQVMLNPRLGVNEDDNGYYFGILSYRDPNLVDGQVVWNCLPSNPRAKLIGYPSISLFTQGEKGEIEDDVREVLSSPIWWLNGRPAGCLLSY